jgi:long-chain acyl-CoA synthetase
MERKANSFMTVLGDVPYSASKRCPDKLAVIHGEVRLTWKDFNDRINSLANALIDMGMQKGDRCAILELQSHRYAELYLAMAKAGIIAVPLNYRLAPKELAFMINDSGSKGIFAESRFCNMIDQIRDGCDTLKTFVGMGDGHQWKRDYERLLADYPTTEPDVLVEESDLFRIVYTGGTTGLPKGVMGSHKNTMAYVMSMHLDHRPKPSDIFGAFAGFPLAGVPLLMFGYMLLGCTTVIDNFSPERFCELIEKERITATILVPTVIIMLLQGADFSKYDLSSLKQFQYGASPMPIPVLEKLMAIFPGANFLQIYGATETSLTISVLPPDDHKSSSKNYAKRIGSIGRAAYNVDIQVIDDNGKEVPRGEIGEVVSRSAMIMEGYWNNDEATFEALKYGCCHIGDLGYMDDDGYIFLVDRKKDMIISGGYNVYSKEVENALYLHPAVEEAAVIGVPDPQWGEAIKGLVKLKEGMSASEEELLETCRQNIARFKVPKTLEFVDELPHTVLGKIQKAVLREKYWKGHEKRIYGGG